jgi:RNA polymerase sigma-70 factor (ECF subfamily)
LSWKHLSEKSSAFRVFSPQGGVHSKETMAPIHAASLVNTEQAQRANAAIAAGLRRHDPDVMEQLIELYQHRLFRYLLFLTGNRDLSQDLFQETWMRVLERGSQYNGRARFDTWMFTIARNLMIDHTRKRVMVSLDEVSVPDARGEAERPMDVIADTPSPFDHFRSQEQAARVGQALLGLPPVYREVLVLRFHEDLSLEEISQVSNAPLSTVKSRLYRGMAALKPALEASREVPA